MREFQQVLQDDHGIGAGIVHLAQRRHHGGGVAAHRLFEQLEHAAAIGETQHVADLGGIDHAAAVGDRLVEHGEPVAHRAVGGARQQRQRLGRDLDLFGRGDTGEVLDQNVVRHTLEVEALAAAQHRHRHLADLGGGEQELHMRRRLFKRLQQGVEGLLRQHVHFVDDVDLVAGRDGAVAHAFDQFAHVVDAGARGRVHLDDIDVAVLGDGLAVVADAARIDRRAALAVGADAVECPGDDAGGRGLADAAHARKHEGVGDAAGGDGVAQGAHHCFLADQGGEIGGSVFTGKDAVGKRGLASRVASCLIASTFGGLRHGDHPLKRRGPLSPAVVAPGRPAPRDGVRGETGERPA